MRTGRISFVLASLGLSGCATLGDPSPPVLPLTASPDEHAEFHSLSAVAKEGRLEVGGWARSKTSFVSGTVHIEALLRGSAVAAVDVPWRSPSHTRLRRHRKSFYFSAGLPRDALAADSIRVSHGHRGHSHTSREEAAQ